MNKITQSISYLNSFSDLISCAFSVDLNANDTFWYASAFTVIMVPSDLEWILPIYSKYLCSRDAYTALMAFIIRKHPIKELDTLSYRSILKEFIDLNLDRENDIASTEYNEDFKEF